MRRLSLLTALVALFASTLTAHAEGTPPTDANCMVARGEAFGAVVIGRDGRMLESIRIPLAGEPVVNRSATGRGALRKHCEVFILESLGRARAKQILRLSD